MQKLPHASDPAMAGRGEIETEYWTMTDAQNDPPTVSSDDRNARADPAEVDG